MSGPAYQVAGGKAYIAYRWARPGQARASNGFKECYQARLGLTKAWLTWLIGNTGLDYLF